MNINESITYQGIVDIQLQNKNIKKHNTATFHMFELLLRVLGKQTFDSKQRPIYITILDNNGLDKDSIINNPYLDKYANKQMLNRLLLTTDELALVDTNNYSITFSANFDKSCLSKSSLTDPTNSGFVCLVDGYKQSILAVTTIDNDMFTTVNENPTYQSMIYWTITLSSNT